MKDLIVILDSTHNADQIISEIRNRFTNNELANAISNEGGVVIFKLLEKLGQIKAKELLMDVNLVISDIYSISLVLSNDLAQDSYKFIISNIENLLNSGFKTKDVNALYKIANNYFTFNKFDKHLIQFDNFFIDLLLQHKLSESAQELIIDIIVRYDNKFLVNKEITFYPHYKALNKYPLCIYLLLEKDESSLLKLLLHSGDHSSCRMKMQFEDLFAPYDNTYYYDPITKIVFNNEIDLSFSTLINSIEQNNLIILDKEIDSIKNKYSHKYTKFIDFRNNTNEWNVVIKNLQKKLIFIKNHVEEPGSGKIYHIAEYEKLTSSVGNKAIHYLINQSLEIEAKHKSEVLAREVSVDEVLLSLYLENYPEKEHLPNTSEIYTQKLQAQIDYFINTGEISGDTISAWLGYNDCTLPL